jgi:homopolymeric O-antigen transport system permease protein
MRNSQISQLIINKRLLFNMTKRDFQSKYIGSFLGVFWTVLNPIILMIIFTFIFAVVFKARFGNNQGLGISALYIICGILPWLAFQEGLGRAGTVVFENKNLVTRALFPLSVLPAFPVLSSLSGHLTGIVIVTLVAAITMGFQGYCLLLIPVLLFLQLLFTVGLSFLISAFSVYLKDIVHLLPVILLVWLYGTPVFYPAEMVPPKYQILVQINPMAHFVSSFRKIILEGTCPEINSIIILTICSVFSLFVGSFVFGRLKGSFADRL